MSKKRSKNQKSGKENYRALAQTLLGVFCQLVEFLIQGVTSDLESTELDLRIDTPYVIHRMLMSTPNLPVSYTHLPLPTISPV